MKSTNYTRNVSFGCRFQTVVLEQKGKQDRPFGRRLGGNLPPGWKGQTLALRNWFEIMKKKPETVIFLKIR